MFGINQLHRIFSTLTALALILALSASSASALVTLKADITVKGRVTINGQRTVSNSTVVSGSKITTGSRSHAIIGLGANGRIELSSNTSVTLNYSDNSIVALLSSGKVRVTSASGIVTSVTTRSATVTADQARANTFSVDIGCGDDVKCSQTVVRTTTGLVTLKTSDFERQVAAGDEVAGGGSQNGCKPCYRPGSSPPVPIAGFGSGGLPAILILLGSTVATSIIAGKKESPPRGGGIDVSPIL